MADETNQIEIKVVLNQIENNKIEPLKEVLSSLDTDGDGSVSPAELARDGALDKLHAVLSKLGLNDTEIKDALNIDAPAVRKTLRDEKDKRFRDTPKKAKKKNTN